MRKSICAFVRQLRGPHFEHDQPSRTWKFNLQTKDAAGVRLPVATYEVQINAVAPDFTVTSAFQLGVR